MVMIGDNIESDIVGPSKVGWDTILVKTGVAKSDYALATINSGHIYEGIESYCKLKNIQIY
jgi:ribonucleotide monophosphatase NagD (HAD superfamily)